MNKIKYIIGLLAIITIYGCQEDEWFKSKGDIRVKAGFAETRTTFTEDNGTVHVCWNAQDAIGLFTSEQTNLRYTASNTGAETSFNAGSEKLVAKEGETVYAYYPYNEEYNSRDSKLVKLPNQREQKYQENASELDFIYASNTVTNRELQLQFKHLFAFLKITIPLDLVQDNGGIGLELECTEDICVQSGLFNLEKQELTADKFKDIYYTVPDDVTPDEKGEITCYIAILPVKENVQLKIFTRIFTSSENEWPILRGECLLTKNTPVGGFKAGNVYTLYLNESEAEGIAAMERDALIALYKATDGDNWTHNDNWCTDKPIEEWYGVETLNNRIHSLHLNSNNLTGKIPIELFSLETLGVLDLGYNKLTGNLPEEIGNLTELDILKIWFNQINGTLPETIGNLTNLGQFYCAENPITGTLPSNIGNLKRLYEIYMGDTYMEGEFPASFYELTNLKYFYATNKKPNTFSGYLSPKIENLKNLIVFDVRGMLSGKIPPEIGNLPNLEQLWLENNQLSGEIPSEIGSLAKLEWLRLGDNQLSGQLPSSIGNLKKLTNFSIGNNQFSGSIPSTIGNWTSLEVLEMGKTPWTGEIPPEIGNLQNLKVLYLAGKIGEEGFSGNIPAELGKLNKLERLCISDHKHLTGEIPPSIGNLKNLQSLELMRNSLTGSLPSELGNLTNLNYVALQGNNLSGEIPESITKLACWQYMWWNIIGWNNIDTPLDKGLIPGPTFNVTDLDGNAIHSQTEYAKNKFTILVQWAGPGNCDYSTAFMKTLNGIWDKYKSRGVDIIGWNPGYEDANLCKSILSNHKVQWRNFRCGGGNSAFGGIALYPETLQNLHRMVLTVHVVDNEGKIVFSGCSDDDWNPFKYRDLPSFIARQFGETSGYYESTDFSKDGEVETLQKATVGKGIDIVFMGEGFVDKDLEEPSIYKEAMREAMEQFFSIEPYKSFRNRFNVYMVKAVSPNAEFAEDAKNAFNLEPGKCFAYAAKVSGIDTDRLMVNVIYNTSTLVGRSFTLTASEDGSYVAFMMEGVNNVLNHEAGGHGVANLLDEYIEPGNELLPLPDSDKSYLDEVWEKDWGWGANVDYRPSPAKIRWAHLLADPRYKDEVGIYEGSYLYGFGAYRPSFDSMMNQNINWFNAPSREAIYKAIMTLSEGLDWVYNYEDFAAYDAINRGTPPVTRTISPADIERHKKSHRPPVIIKGTWRDAMKSRVKVPFR